VENPERSRLTPGLATLLALALSGFVSTAAFSGDCFYSWTKAFPVLDAGNDRGLAVSYDLFGNPLIVGFSSVSGEGNNWLIYKLNRTPSAMGTPVTGFPKPAGSLVATLVNSDDRATCIAAEISGSIYVAGFVDRSSENTGKDWRIIKYSSSVSQIWSRTYSGEINGPHGPSGGPDPNPPASYPYDEDDRALGIAVDVSGSVIAAGYETNVWIDPLRGRKNLLVRKYDADGNLIWSASSSGTVPTQDAVANAVCTDSFGNIIVVGYEGAPGGRNSLVIKYDPTGLPLWSFAVDYAGGGDDELKSVGVDAAGNIYAVGYAHRASDDGLLVKYSPSGVRLLFDYGDGPTGGDERMNVVAVLSDGRFAVGGYTRRFDGAGGRDWLFGKYDSAGNEIWADTYDSPAGADDEVCGMAFDSSTGLVVAGYETRGDLGRGEDWRVTKYPDQFACPTIQISASKNLVAPEEEFSVTVSVANAGEGLFPIVRAYMSAASGSSLVAPVSGPVPTVVSGLDGLTTSKFVWTWRAVDSGTVGFSATVTGLNNTATVYMQEAYGVTIESPASVPLSSMGTMGTDFWLAFMQDDAAPSGEGYSVLVAGPTGATVKVETPWGPAPVTAVITPGGTARLNVDATAGINTSGNIENRGIHVTATADVAVYGFNNGTNGSSDGTMVLPAPALGCGYLVLGYGRPGNPRTQLVVVASQNGTWVTITPSAAVAGHASGTPFTVYLNQGEAYRLALTTGPADLAGTVVTASNPVAVFGGAVRTGVPLNALADGNHLFEQMLPTKYWGTRFITVPMGGRRFGDTFMILSGTDGTGVSVSGFDPIKLNRGETRELIIEGPAEITSDKPLAVAQYSNNYIYDNQFGDPAMMLVPSVDQHVSDAWIPSTSATLFTNNYIGVSIPSSAAGSVQVEGAAVSATCFTAVGPSGYSAGALWVAPGGHHVTASAPFGLQTYGFAQVGTVYSDAYAWTGPLTLSARSRLALAGPSSGERWKELTFSISCINREGQAADFTVWDTIPAGARLVSASNGGTLYGGTVAWTLNGVPAGGTGKVTFVLKVLTATSSIRQQVTGYFSTAAAPCPVPLGSNTLLVPVSVPPPAPVKVYPNPFNPEKAVNGVIKFRGLKVGGKLRIFTVSGRLVWDDVAGIDPIEWDGKNSSGEKVAPGVYLWVAEGELGKERGKIFLQR